MGWGARLRELPSFFLNPRPSLFDLCAVSGVVGMGFVTGDLRGLYFVFYSFFMVMVGFSQKCERNIQAPGLTLVCLVGFASLFIHSFDIYRRSLTFAYLNVYLMMEGFIYVFAGCVLFYILVSKGRNLRLFALTLPVALLHSVKYAVHGGQVSLFFAFVVGLIVYLALQRRFLLLGVLVCLTLSTIAWYPLRFGGAQHTLFSWLCLKFHSRPMAWLELCRMIAQHPFVGEGFNKIIGGDSNSVAIWNDAKTVLLNCVYRPNDYLNIAQIYGLPVLVGIGWFIKDTFHRLGSSFLLAPFVAICALCFVQITMFWPDKALAVVCVVATFYTET